MSEHVARDVMVTELNLVGHVGHGPIVTQDTPDVHGSRILRRCVKTPFVYPYIVKVAS